MGNGTARDAPARTPFETPTMPTCSPARLTANRANALRSTGPKTAAGKERSRSNALKHGLTGAGVAIPTEDLARVEERFGALSDELAPRTVLGAVLVKRVAMISVRLDRCVTREAAALSDRSEQAGDAFDEARMEEVQRLVNMLNDDPAGAVRKLRRMPEGVDRIIAGWTSIRQDLDDPGLLGWYTAQRQLATMLEGRPSGSLGSCRAEALFLATSGEFHRLVPGDGDGLDDLDRREWAVDRLRELVDARLADLRDHRATLDLDAIARARARSADKSLFDPSPEAVLARKYEAAAERALFRTLQELRQVEAEAKPEPEAPPETESEAEAEDPPGPEAERLGSFCPGRRADALPFRSRPARRVPAGRRPPPRRV